MLARPANGQRTGTKKAATAHSMGSSLLTERRIAMCMSKYGNKKTVVDGIEFDSKKEAHRWIELKYMERAGLIRELQRQVPFVLIPTQKNADGKVVEREVRYIADFVYRNKKDNRIVVEDSKGYRTDVFKIKKKLMLYRHGIQVKEV